MKRNKIMRCSRSIKISKLKPEYVYTVIYYISELQASEEGTHITQVGLVKIGDSGQVIVNHPQAKDLWACKSPG